MLTFLLKNRHDVQPTAWYTLSLSHLCGIIPTLLCEKGIVYSAVYHFFMVVKPLMESVSQNRMWKIDDPLKALWKGTKTCSGLKESIVCKYERKNRYQRRGTLFLLSIKITTCVFGYILMKTTSLQRNGKFLLNFMQMSELETTKLCYSTNSFKRYSARQTALPFLPEGEREQNSILAFFIQLCTYTLYWPHT